MKIAYCSAEVFPFAKSGGLGDVGGSLPIALEELGHHVSVFMPKFRSVGKSGPVIEQLKTSVFKSEIGENVDVYFIDNPKYFDREGLYGDLSGEYPDNLERFSFFSDQVLKFCKEFNLQPDIVHCHDWHTALIPVYLKERYKDDPFFADTKSMLTIHNCAFQGLFPKEQFSITGLSESLFKNSTFKFHDQLNLLKAGIVYSDQVTTVSPQYAKEIQSKQCGCGLQRVLKKHKNRIFGILNGLDYTIWDPNKDSHITEQYTRDNVAEAKLKNKAQLQTELGLYINEDAPLFGFVGRLSEQKGIDLILNSAAQIINQGAQLIVLGSGDSVMENKLKHLASKNTEQVAVHNDFNEALGHQIYAGCDFFLMPSAFEPCGLSQMISFSYGTIPIVFKTGGLIDTVRPFGPLRSDGNGLMFTKHTDEAFSKAINKAFRIFNHKKQLNRLRTNAMESMFTWTKSALHYQELYQCA